MLSSKGIMLIEHVKQSIERAKQELSSLPDEILALEGLTSRKIKHLLNNICSLKGGSYLEIGVWKGATFIAALYHNQLFLQQAIAIDNWSQFEKRSTDFINNCAYYLPNTQYTFYSQDCFTVDFSLFARPINIYFYDAAHTQEAQEKAFTYFNPIFDDIFIAIIDNWNWQQVQKGTYAAFEKLNYTILFEEHLPAHVRRDATLWWDGILVAVIQKKVT